MQPQNDQFCLRLNVEYREVKDIFPDLLELSLVYQTYTKLV